MMITTKYGIIVLSNLMFLSLFISLSHWCSVAALVSLLHISLHEISSCLWYLLSWPSSLLLLLLLSFCCYCCCCCCVNENRIKFPTFSRFVEWIIFRAPHVGVLVTQIHIISDGIHSLGLLLASMSSHKSFAIWLRPKILHKSKPKLWIALFKRRILSVNVIECNIIICISKMSITMTQTINRRGRAGEKLQHRRRVTPAAYVSHWWRQRRRWRRQQPVKWTICRIPFQCVSDCNFRWADNKFAVSLRVHFQHQNHSARPPAYAVQDCYKFYMTHFTLEYFVDVCMLR